MRILITGGAGYLGSVLTQRLLACGHEVCVLDNFQACETSLLHLIGYERFKIVRGDVRNIDVVRPLVMKADALILLAALVGAPICARDPVTAVTVNTDAVRMILELTSRDQKVLYPCTNSGYGVGGVAECDEESPLRPISLYGTSKVEAEKIVMDRGNAVSFRLATLFGVSPRMRTDLLVNDFVRRAVCERAIVLFEGGFRRNFLHVIDAAKTFNWALDRWDAMRDNVYNVGLSAANMTKRELCEWIKFRLPDTQVIETEVGEDPDKRDYVVSNAKIEATGWYPGHNLDDGIRELIVAYSMLNRGHYANV